MAACRRRKLQHTCVFMQPRSLNDQNRVSFGVLIRILYRDYEGIP